MTPASVALAIETLYDSGLGPAGIEALEILDDYIRDLESENLALEDRVDEAGSDGYSDGYADGIEEGQSDHAE